MLALTLLAPLLAPTPPADDWPQWRGPNRTGVSPETRWVSEGAEEPLWTVDVGRGYSSPSIANGRLFVRGFFGGDGEEKTGVDVTSCLDAETGETIWTHESPSRLWDNMHGGGTLTTPTVDGDVVYALSRMGPLVAHSVEDGEVIWERQLDEELSVGLGPFGLCSSPVVIGDVLYLNVGKTVALDKRTGKTIWETKDYGPSYATPEPFELDGKELLAIFNAAGLAVLERASGKELALHPWTSNYNVNAASPIVVENRIFISTGYNEIGCAMLALTDEGLEVVWANRSMNSLMNGCVLVDDMLVGFDRKELSCLDLDGKVLWTERGLGRGTVIAADDRLIVLSEDGELIVAPVSRESFQPESRVKVFDEGPCWTTPVLASGRIYCRNGLGELVCRDHRATD